jgi:hypothetical protein
MRISELRKENDGYQIEKEPMKFQTPKSKLREIFSTPLGKGDEERVRR